MKILTNKQMHRLEDLAYSEGYELGLEEGKVRERKIIGKMLEETSTLFYYKGTSFINKDFLKDAFEKASTPEEFCEWLYNEILK